jgi:threonine dehydrogenase-like Zn-dependent dehydrogenase
VLGNKVVVGSVNASRDHFAEGIKDLSQGAIQWPGWLSKLLTHRIDGLENYGEIMRLLTKPKATIKVYVKVADE